MNNPEISANSTPEASQLPPSTIDSQVSRGSKESKESTAQSTPAPSHSSTKDSAEEPDDQLTKPFEKMSWAEQTIALQKPVAELREAYSKEPTEHYYNAWEKGSVLYLTHLNEREATDMGLTSSGYTNLMGVQRAPKVFRCYISGKLHEGVSNFSASLVVTEGFGRVQEKIGSEDKDFTSQRFHNACWLASDLGTWPPMMVNTFAEMWGNCPKELKKEKISQQKKSEA